MIRILDNNQPKLFYVQYWNNWRKRWMRMGCMTLEGANRMSAALKGKGYGPTAVWH